MDDSLKTLDLSAEGTVSVPVAPPVVDTPTSSVVTSTNGPTEKNMGKKTKILAGVLTAILLFGGLGVGLFLAKQKQTYRSKASSPGDCRCSGRSIICEVDNGDGTTHAEWKGDDASCVEGTPPSFEKHEDPVTNQVTTTWESTNTTGSNAGLATNPPAETQTTTTTTTNLPAKPSSNTSSDNLKVGADGGWIVKDTVVGQKVDNACNVTLACKTRADWEKGWFDARKESQYLNGNVVAKQPEYTDIARDLDNNPQNGIQVGTITNNGGVLEIKDIFTVTSANTGTCALNDYGCIETYLRNNPGANNSISLSGQVGYIDKTGKIVFNSTASSGTYTGKIIYDGGGLTRAQCTTTNSVNSFGQIINLQGLDAWCGGIPEASADQPLLKNGFCGIAGIQKGLTCDQQFKANFGFNYTGGCGTKSSPTGGDGSLGNLDGCGYSSSTVNGFQWTWDMYKGFTITSLGTGAQKVRYVCKDQSTLVGGCTCAVSNATCTRYDNSVAFDWNQCGVQQIDIDVPNGSGGVYHVSRNIVNENCGGGGTTTTTTTFNNPGGGSNPPGGGSNPTPTPTTTTSSSYACYQLQIFRVQTPVTTPPTTVQIQPWQINQGDALIFRGFATATNTTVSKMRFVVSINGVAQAPVDVNASLISGQYQADLPYTITQVTSYSVTTTPISP